MAPVIGNNNNNNLTFQGTVQNVATTLTNPYSGFTVIVTDTLNVNNTTYDGLGGTDTLVMSAMGDYLSLDDGSGNSTVSNIERFIAGAGGDVIILSDDTLVMGDTVISGGDSSDVLWANVGNDTVNAGNGDDQVSGGPGSDALNGQNDNDLLFGDSGDDMLSGGLGDDTQYGGLGSDVILGDGGVDFLFGDDGPGSNPDLYAHTEIYTHSFSGASYLTPYDTPANVDIPPDNQAVQAPNVAIDYTTTVTATYLFSSAGYHNSLGFYRIGADGSINDVEIVMKNQHQQSYGTSFTYDYNGEAGDALGIFIVANGYGVSAPFRNTDLSTGTLHFVYDYGLGTEREASFNDDGNHVSLVFDNGSNDFAFNVDIYHSSLSGGTPTLNRDGLVHVMSGLADGNPDVLRIGFEDLNYLGDADFDDVVFDMTVANHVIEVFGDPDSDTLIGGAGTDTMYGGFGDDLLVDGIGANNFYGGEGSDTFAFDAIDNQVDTIHDYTGGTGGDIINLTDILSGFDPMADIINDFVRLVHNGGDDDIYVNADGDSGGAFTRLATILGGTGADISHMIADGNLVLDHSAIA